MWNKITSLPENNPNKKILTQQFQEKLCNVDNRSVWCCRDGNPPSKSEIKLLSNENSSNSDNQKISGKIHNRLCPECFAMLKGFCLIS